MSGPALSQDHARHSGEQCTPEAVIAAMQAGHPDAQATVARYVDRLARALAQVVNLLDPDVIVLGGGLSRVTALYPAVNDRIARYTFSRPITTTVCPAMHGDASGVRGAAWLALRT